jgi:hypothetical protein
MINLIPEDACEMEKRIHSYLEFNRIFICDVKQHFQEKLTIRLRSDKVAHEFKRANTN